MVHILGMGFRGIGIALLGAILLLAVLLLLALFVPVRYRIRARKPENGSFSADITVSWLLRAAFGFGSYGDSLHGENLHYGLRLFGFPAYDNRRKARRAEKARQRAVTRQKKAGGARRGTEETRQGTGKACQKTQETRQKPEKEQTIRRQMENTGRGAEPGRREDETKKPSPGAETTRGNCPGKTARRVRKNRRFSRPRILTGLKAIRQKWMDFTLKIQNILRKLAEILQIFEKLPDQISERLEALCKRLEAWRAFLEREELRRSVALCRREIAFVWRALRPKKCRLRVRFGASDPSVTGQALAYAGILYPLLGQNITIRPDFEREVLDGELLIKGRIALYRILWALFTLYRSRDVKRTLRVWRRRGAA